ncbi:alpha/beta hydrolase [Halogranum rubrum]|uniref:Esterase n=1 Tax=Halogranum salarium B-1 TaxID=1210908 RepID=J3JFC4_9EURY|nr:dienelactone hydrolase family protein [Halogranum salarium]EJN59129.1 esterase [Halogranum salarium B-1]
MSGGDRGGPHDGQPIETAGAPFQVADAAVVVLHGRGDSPKQFLRLADEFHHRGVLYLAPEAAGRAWFPGPVDEAATAKEPWLSSAFRLVDRTLDVAADAGVPPERVVFVGFSQGASLAAEYVASHPRRYGGLAVLAGSLFGQDAAETDHDGSLDETPVFLGCGADDPHVATERVRGSAATFRRLGGEVTDRVYDDLGHVINDDEIREVDRLVASVTVTEDDD